MQEFLLNPSKRYRICLVALTLATSFVICLLDMNFAFKIILLGLLLCWVRRSWLKQHEVLALRCLVGGQWQVETKAGFIDIEFDGQSVITQYAMFLRVIVNDLHSGTFHLSESLNPGANKPWYVGFALTRFFRQITRSAKRFLRFNRCYEWIFARLKLTRSMRCLIFPDSLVDRDRYRQLIVLLRTQV